MSERTWVARLTPIADSSVERLLNLPLGLDVWERHPDSLVVAATEGQLAELERRRLADVERWAPREEFASRPPSTPPTREVDPPT
ncbi:MAG TPA: hypothetical protein VLK57_13445 [Pseudonocardia sp.]|jgi:hypothetical protein|nr:hypothetical protein [Pseudonocardia sp.]